MGGGEDRQPGATHIYTASSSGRAASATNYDTGMMILALAMGHTVARPAIRMGGGTKNL